jgi:integrase/recombinase XerD
MVAMKSLTTKNQTKQVDGDKIIEMFINKHTSANTRRIYAKSIYEFFTWKYGEQKLTLQMMIIESIEAEEYMNIYLEMVKNKTMKKSTYNCKIKGIKLFYEWLLDNTTFNNKDIKLLNINPFKNISQLKEKDAQGSDFLKEDELKLMLNNPYGDTEHLKKRNLLILILAVTTGIRNNALLSMSLDNIKMIDGKPCVVIYDKGEKETEKELRQEYYEDLMEWYDEDIKMRKENTGTIFNILPITAGKIITKWAKEVGIEKRITFHSLRTTSAIMVYKNTGNVYEVQKFMNHESINTTNIYLKKEDEVNHHGTNLLINMDVIDKFDKIVDTLDKDILSNLIKSLDVRTKIELYRQIER